VNRSDVVICAAPRDYGRPRPAVVVQSDLVNQAHHSIVVCPITSELVDAPLFRIEVEPTVANGLRKISHVMVDKIVAIRRDRIGRRAGTLSKSDMDRVDAALRFWLELA